MAAVRGAPSGAPGFLARSANPSTAATLICNEETLLHVSILLKAAEEVSDEITERASGIERGLIWSMIHSVEMARAVVDALLDGAGRQGVLREG
ncbi:hypothetical protein [Pseudomonas chlororaphis]|uniref:hypothetical protein n=1 Tax=Pseudomonas chlororaphis TaxID=587753 RepID=UPI000F716F5F|nr:hypothetical protein [Pseudomonas chlororaphis]AZC48400.1 hypothetical protein C4K35_0795 [Pseudomonas chlororaphis subsp. piscium]AZC54976.1 hypothetical protein C4K34_0789 [Pseudomonas chlororaphis subsp. piscium]AZC67520.1 hypothetical protein C4K32_0836 [Pseudomonas chlororaphis subsp. piscium]AZC73709.1 hypothetical protein C4K31_0784 [Pseudomonas chlororaphis subsp. piscium]AZC79934.1 hypothetical protein C4K30_0798 [Pseudomonas chlororaphis subsp. piscium]